MEKVNLVIIIVNYNSPADVLECVESIKQSQKMAYSYRIIVVDNCSTDNSVLLLDNKEFDFFQLSANNGYCAGNNAGIKYADSKYEYDYVWILNPDTEIENTAIENLLNFAYANPVAGLIGASLIYNFDRDTIQAIGGGNIGLSKKMNFQILKPYFHNELFSEKKNLIPEVLECKSLIGAALLIKKDIFNKIGYFDESYFLYSDETEYCIRVLKKTKYKLYAVKNVIVYHKEGSRKKERKFVTQYYLTRNWLYNVKKYYPYLLPYVYIYHCIYLFKIKRKKELSSYIKRALLDFLKGQKGKYSQ